MKSKFLVTFIIAIVLGLGGTGSMTTLYLVNENRYSTMDNQFTELQANYTDLLSDYHIILQ
jgi:hypothetical protein